MAALGILFGAVASLLVARWIRGLLFGVQPFDPATLGSSRYPVRARGRRSLSAAGPPAARADPLMALRND